MKDSITLSQELVEAIDAADDISSMSKQAAAATEIIRTRIREDGFQRKILPFKKISNSDCNELPDTELPAVIELLEPDSPASKSISYNDTPNSVQFRAEKFVVLIHTITTEELTKNINELRMYRHDVQSVVVDNLLRDISVEEDATFMSDMSRIVGSDSGNPVDYPTGYTGAEQNVKIDSKIDRESYKLTRNFLEDRNLIIGTALINRRTANEFIGWDRNEIGGDLAQATAQKGLKGLGSFEVMGIPHIATIKRDLVANGEVWQFAPANFLGVAYMLEDVKLTIKKEYDIIRIRANEQIGVAIGNTNGVQRVEFTKQRYVNGGTGSGW